MRRGPFGAVPARALELTAREAGAAPRLFAVPGFILDKKFGLNQSNRVENARILIANTRTEGAVVLSWLWSASACARVLRSSGRAHSPPEARGSVLRERRRWRRRADAAAMDTDKIKVFGARVKVDSPAALAEIERAERVCRCLRSVRDGRLARRGGGRGGICSHHCAPRTMRGVASFRTR